MLTITREVVKRCPHKDEVDRGGLAIRFDGDAPELHALARCVERLSAEPISHEDYTRGVVALLPPGSHVATVWQTAGWTVTVESSAVLHTA